MTSVPRLRATCLLAMACTLAASAAENNAVIRLWPDSAKREAKPDQPEVSRLTVYPAGKEKNAGVGLIICPGGGYSHVAIEKEGIPAARWANSLGITAFILNYRHAPLYRHPAPLQDAQQAIRIVRSRAGEWDLKPDRIGIMGFSAGGHLASTAGTHFEEGKPDAKELLARTSTRPDFLILCYPVISLTEVFAHAGSRKNLLGENPSEEQLRSLSNETQVTPRTPPAFLWHGMDDRVVPFENSTVFAIAMRNAKVPVELHLYEHAAHGIGLAPNDPTAHTWPDLCANWLRAHDWAAPH